ncbi:MAG: tetratricopeptide repeat protein [Calditrichaeota bacterium]|nr:tetratricopeptide repeat protein [Calditrichota bacterium]
MIRSFFLVLLSFFVLTASDSPVAKKAEQLIKQRKFDQAEQFLKNYKSDPDALYYLSLIRLIKGDIDAAVDYANDALSKSQDKSRFYEWLGDVYAVKAQNSSMFSAIFTVSKIKSNWQKAIKADPKNIDVREKLFMYYLMAPGIAGGDEAKAFELAQQVQKSDPVRGKMLMGRYYKKKEQFSEAENAYLSALKSAPDSTYVLSEIGFFYLDTKKPDKAKKYFLKIIALKPDKPFSYDYLGRFYLKQEKYDSALTMFDKALAIDSLQFRIYFKKAQTLSKLNRKEEAKEIAQYLLKQDLFFSMHNQISKFLKELNKEDK